MHHHPALAPYTLGSTSLRNRLVVAPMTRISAHPDGTPTEAMANYYERLALGGFSVAITEGVYTDQLYSQGYYNQPGIVTRQHQKAWRPIADAVRRQGAQLVMQLMHAGALSQGNRHSEGTAGPSAVRPLGRMMEDYGGSGTWPVPKEMTGDDIQAVVDGFVASARAAQEAGFAGVEVHAANGYLLDQFLTGYTNQRTDEYGGSVTNRIRLTASVISAIRRAVPDPDFWVGVRLSQGKVNDHHYRWPGGEDDAADIFAAVAHATYIHIAGEGAGWAESRLDNGQSLTALARNVTRLPVIANGNLADPGLAAEVIADHHADLISLGRGALGDPDLPRKLAQGITPTQFTPALLHDGVTLADARRNGFPV